jgi:phage shock protein C
MTNEVKRLYRSQKERMIGGICGGLGDFFQVDPIIFRLIFVLMLLGAGSGVLVYIIMMLIIPEEPIEIEPVETIKE